ncbi:MAG: RluA family pseudouridine synthase [Prolixibacteraceae bacterium]|jgi:23S rRNA pseudouridine1911/1915/1917 synthase|nr:RluA family pseudouridine synthase [Prolixibacteraceae bacterium]
MKKKDNKETKMPSDAKKGTVLRVTENGPLLAFLLAQMPSRSRTKIKSLLGAKKVLVDGQAISQFNHPLVPGQKVEINNEKIPAEKKAMDYEMVYEDQDIIVIDKQAGLLSIATEKEKRATAYSMLSDHVKKQNNANKIFIVHRLDRETSGLMLFAKSEAVKRKLQDSWNDTIIDRSYIAVVEGTVEKQKGVVVSYLFEDKSFKMHSSPNPGRGQRAVTHYSLLKKNKKYSLLKINLETGRKNQIRIHAQEMGHSIIGDKKYGALTNPIRRLGLHAQQLSFIHPVTGQTLNFETAVPVAFSRLF